MKHKHNAVLNLPDWYKVQRELLLLLEGRQRPPATQQVYRELADVFKLTLVQRTAPYSESSRTASAWGWLVRQEAWNLQKEGWLVRPQHAMWILTPDGQTEAARERRNRNPVGIVDL